MLCVSLALISNRSCLLPTFSFRYALQSSSPLLSFVHSICIKYYIISLALARALPLRIYCLLVRSVNVLTFIVYLHIRRNKQTAREKCARLHASKHTLSLYPSPRCLSAMQRHSTQHIYFENAQIAID